MAAPPNPGHLWGALPPPGAAPAAASAPAVAKVATKVAHIAESVASGTAVQRLAPAVAAVNTLAASLPAPTEPFPCQWRLGQLEGQWGTWQSVPDQTIEAGLMISSLLVHKTLAYLMAWSSAPIRLKFDVGTGSILS